MAPSPTIYLGRRRGFERCTQMTSAGAYAPAGDVGGPPMSREGDRSSETSDGAAEELQLEPDPDEDGLEPYEVFVQWKRGEPHEHAETIDAPSRSMALMLAKRNVDVRSEPLSIWVAPRRAFDRSAPGDTTLVPRTDRSYRQVGWYAEHRVDLPE